jgi:ABC-type lipoprotein release transport system permease subunit
VLLGASALLALAATAASWLPVRRALKVEPSAALREE